MIHSFWGIPMLKVIRGKHCIRGDKSKEPKGQGKEEVKHLLRESIMVAVTYLPLCLC
jgi:hypothetical protein